MASLPDSSILSSGGRRDAGRLGSIASAADLPTIALLRGLGLPPASTVIDIGCGTGSLARAVAQDIVPEGVVVALDQDISVARDVGGRSENITLVQSDVRTFVPPSPVDLVHARFVLAHMNDRHEVLRRICSWLAPGGHVVVTEPTALPLAPDAPEAVRTVFSAYHRWVGDQGMFLDFATQVPGILTRSGAREVTVHTRGSRFGGGPDADRWLPLIEPIRHHLDAYGVDETMFSRFAAAAADTDVFLIPQIIVTTCARSVQPN